MKNKRFVIENENGLTEKEIVDLFYENENTIKDNECTWVYKCKLVEIIVTLKDGTRLNLLYGDRLEFIDLTLSNYIGLGNFLINPYSNIVKMVVEFR